MEAENRLVIDQTTAYLKERIRENRNLLNYSNFTIDHNFFLNYSGESPVLLKGGTHFRSVFSEKDLDKLSKTKVWLRFDNKPADEEWACETVSDGLKLIEGPSPCAITALNPSARKRFLHLPAEIDQINLLSKSVLANEKEELFVASAGKTTDFHMDVGVCSIMLCVSGEKYWLLKAFDEQTKEKWLKECALSARFKPSDYDEEFLNNCFAVRMLPGDVLILPPNTLHFVYSVSQSIHIIYQFISGYQISTYLKAHSDNRLSISVMKTNIYTGFNSLLVNGFDSFLTWSLSRVDLTIRCPSYLAKVLKSIWDFMNFILDKFLHQRFGHVHVRRPAQLVVGSNRQNLR